MPSDATPTPTRIVQGIEGSYQVQYAPWIWEVTILERGDIKVAHCDPSCNEPADECACYLAGNITTITPDTVRASYEHVARWKGRLCCPDPDDFCAEDADQLLQHMLYGHTVFG